MKRQFMTFWTSKWVLGILLLLSLSLTACQSQPQKFLTEDEVVDLVLALPITPKVYSQIKKATQGQGGVSVIVEPQEAIEQGQKYYVVRIGYNGNERYETYHLLYVNKQDRSDIRIEDPNRRDNYSTCSMGRRELVLNKEFLLNFYTCKRKKL